MARNKHSRGNDSLNPKPSTLNRSRQRTINDLYEQLAHLVDCVSENRHIETMEAFHLCNRMLTGMAIQEAFAEFNDMEG